MTLYLQISEHENIHDTFDMMIYKDIHLSEYYLPLFLNQKNRARIEIFSGSGLQPTLKKLQGSSAQVEFSQESGSKNELIVTPLTLGRTVLVIQDTSLQNSQPVECVIEIIDASRIDLILAEGLVEENSTTKAHLKVFDQDGELIPISQYRFMDLGFQVKRKLYSSAGQQEPDFEIKYLGEDAFMILAHETGDFMVHPKITQESQRRNVVNSPGQISVFRKLKAQPAALFLSSGCLAVLRIFDGPFATSLSGDVELTYEAEKEEVVQVEKLGSAGFHVKALTNSDEFGLVFSVRSKKNPELVLSRVVVLVEIKDVERVQILQVKNRRLAENVTIRMHSVLES